MRKTVTLFNPQQGHAEIAHVVWPAAKALLQAGYRVVIEMRSEVRSVAQNARLWAMLTEISEQVDWHGQRLTPEEWKDIFSAALKRTKVVPGIDGGFVVCGQSTSRMTRGEMTDMQTIMEQFAAEHNVTFRERIDLETGEVMA
jgi:hypothetical protein